MNLYGEREENLNGGLQMIYSGYPWVLEIWVLFFFPVEILWSKKDNSNYLGKDKFPEMGSFRVFPSIQWIRGWEFRSDSGYERVIFWKYPPSGMVIWMQVICKIQVLSRPEPARSPVGPGVAAFQASAPACPPLDKFAAEGSFSQY